MERGRFLPSNESRSVVTASIRVESWKGLVNFGTNLCCNGGDAYIASCPTPRWTNIHPHIHGHNVAVIEKNYENICVGCSNNNVPFSQGWIGIEHVHAYSRVCFGVVTCQVCNRLGFYLSFFTFPFSSESNTLLIDSDIELPAIQDGCMPLFSQGLHQKSR